jgi:ADP-ribosylglycohydrolase
MAMAIFEVLNEQGDIDQDMLAATFARRYSADPSRGYGSGAHELLTRLCRGEDWRDAAPQLFDGQGSMGNGGAMRVAPVGAYFADDYARVIDAAAKSAEVTHAHPEGQAGAVAVAVAAAFAWRTREPGSSMTADSLLETVLQWTPEGFTHKGLQTAQGVPLDEWEHLAADLLGNGFRVTAADTVPFCLWCAAARLHDYSDALWTAARVGGDIDTNCAIVGGIVAMATGPTGIPADWLRSRESLWLSSNMP